MDVFVARTDAEISTALGILSKAAVLGCDTETSGLSPAHGRLLSLQFSDGNFNVLVPVSEGVAAAAFSSILVNGEIVKIFHNARFDLEFLKAAELVVANVFDTMIAEKILTKGAHQSASLADTLYRYFAVDLDKSQRKKFNRRWDGIWTDELVNYALADVTYLPELMNRQIDWMKKLGLTSEFSDQLKKVLSQITSGDKPDALR